MVRIDQYCTSTQQYSENNNTQKGVEAKRVTTCHHPMSSAFGKEWSSGQNILYPIFPTFKNGVMLECKENHFCLKGLVYFRGIQYRDWQLISKQPVAFLLDKVDKNGKNEQRISFKFFVSQEESYLIFLGFGDKIKSSRILLPRK